MSPQLLRKCSSTVITNYASLNAVYSSILSAMVLPVVHSILAQAAPSYEWLEERLCLLPRWIRLRLCRPMPLAELLKLESIDVDHASVRDIHFVEIVRKYLGLSEYFVRWFRSFSLMFTFGKIALVYEIVCSVLTT